MGESGTGKPETNNRLPAKRLRIGPGGACLTKAQRPAPGVGGIVGGAVFVADLLRAQAASPLAGQVHPLEGHDACDLGAGIGQHHPRRVVFAVERPPGIATQKPHAGAGHAVGSMAGGPEEVVLVAQHTFIEWYRNGHVEPGKDKASPS
jgi:hypothetical protein